MNRIDQLVERYRAHIQLPLRPGLPPSQRVWFAVYPAEEERRLVSRIDDFEIATKSAGHPWMRIDLNGSLARWLDSIDDDERSEWFRHPEIIETYAKTEWKSVLTEHFVSEAANAAEPQRTVFALTGLMDLFDYLHVSELIESLEAVYEGYLLIFFPGVREGNIYRFLDARPGWDYQAVPILAEG